MLKAIEFSDQEQLNQQLDASRIAMILKDFRQDGFVVLNDVFTKDYVQSLHTSFVDHYTQNFTSSSQYDKVAVSHRRFQISVDVDGPFNSPRLYANPFVFPIIERLFNYEFIISDLTCVSSLPGARKMVPHADGRIFERHPIANLLPPHAVGLLVPLIPFTPVNGPTRVWPGSQRMGPYFEDVTDKSNFVDLEIDTGSCILMDHRIFHSGNPNLSNQIRPLLYINYSAIWYYDPYNFQKQAPLIVNNANFGQIPEQYKGLFVRRHIKALDDATSVPNS